MPRQDSGVKVLEGNYCDKPGQIGAIGLVGYYGFTTIGGFKTKSVKAAVWRQKILFSDRLYYSDISIGIIPIAAVMFRYV